MPDNPWIDKLTEEAKLFWAVQTAALTALGLVWRASSQDTSPAMLAGAGLVSVMLNLLAVTFAIGSASFIFEARCKAGMGQYRGGTTAFLLIVGHTCLSSFFGKAAIDGLNEYLTQCEQPTSSYFLAVGPALCIIFASLRLCSALRDHGAAFWLAVLPP